MENEKPSPFTDLISGGVWLALAVGIMVISWKMDRLAHLQATIYTAPGLVPGLLGLAIAIMGVLLILRSVRAGALAQARIPRFQPARALAAPDRARAVPHLRARSARQRTAVLARRGDLRRRVRVRVPVRGPEGCRNARHGRSLCRRVRTDLRRRRSITRSRTCSWCGCPEPRDVRRAPAFRTTRSRISRRRRPSFMRLGRVWSD